MTTDTPSMYLSPSETMFNDSIANTRLQNACVLVVDDIALNRKMIESHLRARGYSNIILAATGKDALDATHAHQPDLVILDLMMPGMDGFEYCRHIRHNSAFNHMPIIVQTALDDVSHKINAFKLGASDYLCKPIDGDELEARVRIHLTNKFLIRDLNDFAQRIAQEIEAARAMQDRLMPSEQQIKMCERVFDLNIAAHFETSSALGGDCWGMRPIGDDRLAVFMYDFSGHGITAAMNIFRMHTIKREFSHVGGDPGAFLTTLNRHLHPLLERHEFATMFYGIIDIQSNCLLYASAAASPPLLFSHSQQDCAWLASRGFPLGVLPHATYETRVVPMLPGDLLLMFSDGLVETAGQHLNHFLSEDDIRQQVLRVMGRASQRPSQNVLEGTLSLLRGHMRGTLKDDLTLSVFARNA